MITDIFFPHRGYVPVRAVPFFGRPEPRSDWEPQLSPPESGAECPNFSSQPRVVDLLLDDAWPLLASRHDV